MSVHLIALFMLALVAPFIQLIALVLIWYLAVLLILGKDIR